MLADLSGDGGLDVVAGNADGEIHAFTFPFREELSGWPLTIVSNFQATPASTDLDHDGSPEIVLNSRELRVVRADGSLFNNWPALAGSSTVSPALGDLDGDGTSEVITAAQSTILTYEADGTLRFSTPIAGEFFRYTSIALGDVTGDGLPEVFIGSVSGNLYAFGGDGSLLPGWPVDTGETLTSSALIVDLDDDGMLDVLVLGRDGALHALGADGMSICPPVTLPGDSIAGPAVGDLDGDGLGEVIAPTYSEGVFRLGLPGPWTPRRAAWRMALANERHTGELPPS